MDRGAGFLAGICRGASMEESQAKGSTKGRRRATRQSRWHFRVDAPCSELNGIAPFCDTLWHTLRPSFSPSTRPHASGFGRRSLGLRVLHTCWDAVSRRRGMAGLQNIGGSATPSCRRHRNTTWFCIQWSIRHPRPDPFSRTASNRYGLVLSVSNPRRPSRIPCLHGLAWPLTITFNTASPPISRRSPCLISRRPP
jgi:hypothetical protein